MTYEVHPVGRVESPLTDLADAPRQGDEGAPAAWVALDEAVAPAVVGLAVGDDVVVVTWLDRADRGTLQVHPRSDPQRAAAGVFSTRAPDRPNPIGLHDVRILAIDGTRILVSDLEAVDGTPVLDVKPVLGAVDSR